MLQGAYPLKKIFMINWFMFINMGTRKAQFDFVWIFAVVVGAAILFLAIYGALKAGEGAEFATDSQTAKSISILTDPLQAGFAEGSFGRISFGSETRITTLCSSEGFGSNELSVSTRSSIDGSWNIQGAKTRIANKYIFSDEQSSGEEYYVFSKPFYFPFKVSDLLFFTSQDYCFFDAPDYVALEVEGLNIPNIHVDNCTEESAITVCFRPGGNCDVIVTPTCGAGCESAYEEGIVEKEGSSVKYIGNLLYAAIFSEKPIYECNVDRLLYRSERISENFINKIDLMSARGCNSNLKDDLFVFEASLKNASSQDLIFLNSVARDLERKNNQELCGVW